MAQVGVHFQYGKHYRNVVHHGGNDANADRSPGCAHVFEQECRYQLQVAKVTQATNTHDHAVEEQQGIPLGAGHRVEDVKRHYAAQILDGILVVFGLGTPAFFVQRVAQGHAQEITEELQVAQAHHHAKHWWQVEQLVTQNGSGDG